MKKFWFAAAPVVVTALVACSSGSETTASAAAAQTAQQGPECDFKCKCSEKGGYVKDGWLCCKGDANGTICTNSPESIISWRSDVPPSPKDFPDPVTFSFAK